MSTQPKMARYWVNAPSTLQTDHALHGSRVLAPADLSSVAGDYVDAYFARGPMHSARLCKLTLSPGWKDVSVMNPETLRAVRNALAMLRDIDRRAEGLRSVLPDARLGEIRELVRDAAGPLRAMSAKIMLSPEQLKEAREWLKELTFADMTGADFQAASPAVIERGVERFYDGGLAGFVHDCGPWHQTNPEATEGSK